MIIFRYLLKEFYNHLLAITLVLLIILITHQFVDYLNSAAGGQITMTAVMQLMSLQIPLLVGYMLPLAFYLSILLIFGRLYMDQEMTILSACGMSTGRLLVMVIIIACLVTLVVAYLMLWIEPIAQGYRSRVLEEAIARASIEKVIPKRFYSIAHDGTYYVNQVSHTEKTLKGTFFTRKTQKNWDTIVANSAYELRDPQKGNFIVFKDGYRYIGQPGQANYQIIQFDQFAQRLPDFTYHNKRWPKDASTMELLKLNKSDKKASAELHWRFAMPISVILLTILAFPLSQINPRHGKFTQILPAMLIYIVYGDLLFIGRDWIKQGKISGGIGLWWIHGGILFIGLSLFLYRYWRR